MMIEMPELKWTGDLNDDCHADWNGYHAHVEQMGHACWWFAVSADPYPSGAEFNASDYGISLRSGVAARQMAALVMGFMAALARAQTEGDQLNDLAMDLALANTALQAQVTAERTRADENARAMRDLAGQRDFQTERVASLLEQMSERPREQE